MPRHQVHAVIACALLALMFTAASARSDVVELTSKNFDKLVLKSNDVWMVEFFAPWCGHCKSLAPKYEQLATKTKGLVRVGAVDATVHQDLGQRYGIRGYPTLKIFDFGKKAKKNPEDYQGAREVKAMKAALMAKLRNFSTKIKSSTHEQFIEKAGGAPIAILFTSKKTTTPLFKSLSMRYKGKISLAEAMSTDTELVEKYYAGEEPSFPTLLVVEPDSKITKFEGKLGAATATSFLDKFAGKGGKDGKDAGESADSDSGSPPPPPPMPPLKARPRKAKEVTSGAEWTKQCASKARCVIAALNPKSGDFEAHKAIADELAHKYRRDPLSFVWVDSSAQHQLLHALDSAHNQGDHRVIVLNGKRKKTSSVTDFTASAIGTFLDKLLSGDLAFTALAGDMPVWDAEAASDNPDEELCTTPPEDGGDCGAH